MEFEGSMVAIVTPFLRGKIDEKSYRKLIDRQIELGTDVIIPCGTTGESATMTHEEHKRVMSIAVEHVDRRVPVICGAGSNATEEGLEFVRHAKKIKADGVLVVTPYYNKPTQEGLFRHYEYLAGKVNIPFVLYNVPGRTGVSLSPDTVERLYKKVSNVVAIKEASGSLDQVTEIINRCAITVLSGDDPLTVPMMSIGARGVISVTANILPAEISTMIHAALSGDFETAKDLHLGLYQFSKSLFIETNPQPV